MTNEIFGSLRARDDRWVVRMELSVDCDLATLWGFVTEPPRLLRWLARVTGELSPGGEIEIVFDEDDPHQRITGSVVSCESRDRLEITWIFDDGTPTDIAVTVAGDGGGTATLALEHSGLSAGLATGYGAGWQAYLEGLRVVCAGGDIADGAWEQRWQELKPRYDELLKNLG